MVKKLCLECWSRGRVEHISILLASLHNQTFQDWDITILEEADQNYLGNSIFVGMIRRLKNQGHRVLMMHPRNMLGCVKSATAVMRETNTKYAMKLDDDHMFESTALEKLVNSLDNNKNLSAVGGMLYPIDRELTFVENIPDDFNRWTGEDNRVWNDYTTLAWQFPEQIVPVDFVRAPFMYRADLLRETSFLKEYENLGYSNIAFRIESEITNLLETYHEDKWTGINTSAWMWHYLSPTGGCRMLNYDLLTPDGKLYYDRWQEFHNWKVKKRMKKNESSTVN